MKKIISVLSYKVAVGIFAVLMAAFVVVVVWYIVDCIKDYKNEELTKKKCRNNILTLSIVVILISTLEGLGMGVSVDAINKTYEYETRLYSYQPQNTEIFIVKENGSYYFFKTMDENEEFHTLQVSKRDAEIGYSGVTFGYLEAVKTKGSDPIVDIVLPHNTLFVGD